MYGLARIPKGAAQSGILPRWSPEGRLRPMWRLIPALVLVGALVWYDNTHELSPAARLALYAVCLLLALLCIPVLAHPG